MILVVTLFVLSRLKDRETEVSGEAAPTSVQMDIPDAAEAGGLGTKLDGYRSQSDHEVEDYWRRMGEQRDAAESGEVAKTEDPLAVSGNEKKGNDRVADVTGVSMPSYDEMFGRLSKAAEESKAAEIEKERRREEAKAKRIDDMQKRQMSTAKQLIDYQAKAYGEAQEGAAVAEDPEPVAKEEPVEQIPVAKARVSRAGGVSSMDDEWYQSGTGVSSWDDEPVEMDENYPFKCMFVRQEKLKSGQRVSVRLLEDMIVDGQLVPKNTHLMATCTIGNRVEINVSNIDYRGRIMQLNYDAYDNDGLKGIYAPDLEDAKTLENVKSTLKQSGMSALRSSVGRYVNDLLQAGSLVIQGTGSERTVSIPAGYQFYLVKSKNK